MIKSIFNAEWKSGLVDAGLGYIGDDAGTPPFIPAYGNIAKQPVAGAPALKKRKGLLGKAKKFALPVGIGIAALLGLRFFLKRK